MTLDELNLLLPEQAETEFLICCGSTVWATKMSEARPFTDLDSLVAVADEIWWSLGEDDWLEAFCAHPKIGERKAAAEQSEQAQSWSAQEQSGVATAAHETVDELAQKNREYEDRFAFIFIVCATGKSSAEMLQMLNERLANDRETELRIAAQEQTKITALRLRKLWKE